MCIYGHKNHTRKDYIMTLYSTWVEPSEGITVWSSSLIGTHPTVFIWSDAAATTFFFTARFCAATIRGRHLFLWRAHNINNGWIRYVWVDIVSSKRSLSVMLSAMEASHATQTALASYPGHSPGTRLNSPSASPGTAIRNYLHMCVCAAYSSHGY